MNIWDIAIVLLVGGALVLAVRRVRKTKGGCSCGSCPSCGRACGQGKRCGGNAK